METIEFSKLNLLTLGTAFETIKPKNELISSKFYEQIQSMTANYYVHFHQIRSNNMNV